MHLKSIEIVGFKSFADKTRIELKPGITGVIGPNGCGKSNIMESIRWCIGEMSWKSLRSDSMVSVIFAGTARRSPMNLCEVTLTFDNATSLLPVQYSEVQVARRLFRSGESEYWLNKTQCRLRDIRELFLDTGIGNDGYAIIDQGQVEFVLKAKPEERRALFEEAAGVAKYKAKRTEALRKLERVDVDLGRLQDSLTLINEQIKKLDADARKAQLYKKYKEELAALEAGAIIKEVASLDERLTAERARLTPLAERLAELKTRIGGDEARLAALNLERAAQQGQLIEVNQRISGVKVETAQLEERARSADEMTATLQDQLAQGRKLLDDEVQRAAALEPQLAGAATAHEGAARRAAEAAEALTRFQAEFDELVRARDTVQASLAQARAAVTSAVEEAIQAGRSVSGAESRTSRLEGEIVATRRETEKQAGRLKERSATAGEARAALETGMAAAAAARSAASEAEASATAARQELEALRQRQMELHSEEAGVSARVEALEAQGQRDPYWVGAQAVVAAGIPGVAGTVRQLIEFDEGTRRSIEDALGERLYAVVCSDRSAARTGLELLKGLGHGRARLLVASELPGAEQPRDGGLLARVRFAPENEAVVRYLLGGAREESGALAEGAWLCGGAAAGEAPAAGLADVDALRVRRASLASDLSAVRERRVSLEAEAGQHAQSVRETQAAAFKAEANVHRIEDLLKSADAIVNSLQDELSSLAAQEERQRGDLENASAEAGAAREALIIARSAEAGRREAEAAAQAAVNEAGQRLAVRESEKRHLEASLSEFDRQAQAAKSRLDDIAQARERLEAESADRRARHASWEARLSELAGQKSEALERVGALRVDLSALENESAALIERSQKTALDADELTHSVNGRKAQAEELQGEIHRGEMGLSEATARRGVLVQRLTDEWQLSYEDAKAKYAEAEVDAERLDFLRRRIAALGNINMAAPEEYEELAKRRDAQQAQVDDLNQAKNDLHSVIAKINATTRENFRQTFTEVREHFRKLYAVLFEGGEADLLLTDAEDMLEAGVDIMAQPPGKKLQNLSQLSGGEKTLTAIALLFAFFMVKPSPICMLDEADAALDEANVDRFVSMLREFGGRTQFLIVSHNKKTMEACDAIYGVTMEESGVTQMMSVEFRKAGDKAGEAAPLAKEPDTSQNREPAGEASAG